jgi:acyl-CoA dehydrogenase
MTNDYAVRDRLTSGVYIPQDRKQQMALLEYAFQLVHQSEEIEKKVRKAVRAGQVPKKKGGLAWDEARKANVITEEEYRLVQETEQVRYEAILVDDFSEEQYRARDVIA